jgi:lipopolysaccharide biosynthesis glycosyltransferase
MYFDADVIFLDCLTELDDIDLKDNLIAGVKDILNTKSYWKRLQAGKIDSSLFGGYINSGFMILNLKKIRETGLYEKWLEISKVEKYRYPDQDLFNLTCKERILRLPLRYNFAVWTKAQYAEPLAEGVFSREEYEEAVYNPLVIHYVPGKPWSGEITLDDKWWRYARLTPFYEYFFINFIKPKRLLKIGKLFSFIKILTIKAVGSNTKYYLFGFIPLFRLKTKKIA